VKYLIPSAAVGPLVSLFFPMCPIGMEPVRELRLSFCRFDPSVAKTDSVFQKGDSYGSVLLPKKTNEDFMG
jgi:hypothetical protein